MKEKKKEDPPKSGALDQQRYSCREKEKRERICSGRPPEPWNGGQGGKQSKFRELRRGDKRQNLRPWRTERTEVFKDPSRSQEGKRGGTGGAKTAKSVGGFETKSTLGLGGGAFYEDRLVSRGKGGTRDEGHRRDKTEKSYEENSGVKSCRPYWENTA